MGMFSPPISDSEGEFGTIEQWTIENPVSSLSRVHWLGLCISIISIAMLGNRLCIYYHCDHSWSFSPHSLVFLCLTAVPDSIAFVALFLLMVKMKCRSFYFQCCHGCLSMMVTIVVVTSSAVNIQMFMATGTFPCAVEIDRDASHLH